MAFYKYQNYLTVSKSGAFDLPLQPSSYVPCSGIYRCTGCGMEVALEGIGLLPDRAHHAHTSAQQPIEWQLIVATSSSDP